MAGFPVRYLRQENQGKPGAHNAGIGAARGAFFAVQDSDDWPLPHAVRRFADLWAEIPEAQRHRYTGVTVHTQFPDGRIVGQRFPSLRMDSTIQALVADGVLVGDKWGFHRTEVVQSHPFPRFPGENYVPEGLVWNRIGRRYLMRFADEILQVKEYQPGGITRQVRRVLARSAKGAWLFHRELLDDPLPSHFRRRTAVNVFRYAWLGGGSARESWRAVHHIPLAAAAAAAGAVLALRDRWFSR
jgi:glycosyltransferase involved in cell wall biosynthesis